MSNTIPPKDRIICAIDTDDLSLAQSLAKDLKSHVGAFKIGLEFFTAHGPQGLAKVQDIGMPIMLDLKFHDIPNTVYGAVRSATALGVAMMTLHTGGSSDMMRRAVDAANEVSAQKKIARPALFGVTVLTSLNTDDLQQLGFKQKASDRVKRLAEMAQLCGLDGVVASPRELAMLQDQRSREFQIITPGIRPSWSANGGNDDQKRIMTPAEAIQAGSDYLVIGRPITKNADPVGAAKKIVEEINSVL